MKTLINRNGDLTDGGGGDIPTGKVLQYPRHDFGLDIMFQGRYEGPHENGYIFSNEKGKFLIPSYERVTEAINQIESGTLLHFKYEGNGEFTIEAPEL